MFQIQERQFTVFLLILARQVSKAINNFNSRVLLVEFGLKSII